MVYKKIINKASCIGAVLLFLCICDEPGEICSVERVIPGTALYINPKEHCYCAYLRTYGAEFICNCPVRHELYEKYNI